MIFYYNKNFKMYCFSRYLKFRKTWSDDYKTDFLTKFRIYEIVKEIIESGGFNLNLLYPKQKLLLDMYTKRLTTQERWQKRKLLRELKEIKCENKVRKL